MAGGDANDLQSLAEKLVRRKRLIAGVQTGVDGLLIAGIAALLLAVVDLFLVEAIAGFPLVAGLLAAGLVLGYARGSSRRPDRYRALLEADRAYRTREQLATAFELSDAGSPFAKAIARRAIGLVGRVDPKRLYKPEVHRRYLLLPALLLATAVVAGLETTPAMQSSSIVQLGGAEAPESEGPATVEPDRPGGSGVELADEVEGSREEGRQADDASSQRTGETGEVEEQVRELARESLEDDDIRFGETAEEAFRGALRRGMSESEILDVITQMQEQGSSTADIVEELSEGESSLPSDANSGNEVDEDAVENLSSQLVPVPPSENEEPENSEEGSSDTGNPTQGGEAEIAPGVDAETGEAQGSSERQPPEEQSPQPETEGEEQARRESPSDRGGRAPAADTGGDDFAPTNESRVAAEITGTVVEETFLNLVIRDLPQEAASELEDLSPDVRYERAVEQAIARETVPEELEPLVRSYFLRIARRTGETETEGERE